YTITCGASQAACDGKSGCCAADDLPSYQARKMGQPAPPRQAVQLIGNSPSRTAVDFNGDLWIANRAPGGQASITRLASDASCCPDRNHDGKLQTSSDVNGDGLIETDCN